MVDDIKPNSPAMKAAGGAWDRFRKDPSTEGPARLRVEADLRALAATGVPFENLDPVRITAVNTFGGAAVFGFRTAAGAAAAAATGTVGDIAQPGPSAAAAATADAGADDVPKWWRQAYAEQQEKDRELQTQQTKDRADLQAQNQSMLNQLGNSNLIQQQMLGQLDQHRIAIGDLQNGQQQQGAAIGDLQNGQQQHRTAIDDLQNGQLQQRAAIAELQDWQQRLIVEGALGGTKANLDNLRFESDPACSAAPPAAIGVHDTAGAAQAAPIVHADGSPPSPDKKMPARPVPFSSTKSDGMLVGGLGSGDGRASALQPVRRSAPSLGRGRAIFGTGACTGTGALAGGRSSNGAYPSSPPNTSSPSTNRKRSAKPSPSPSRHAAPSFGRPHAVVGTGTPKNPRAAITGDKRQSSPSSKVGLFDEMMGGYNADASTPPTAMAVADGICRHPPSRPPPLKMRPEPEPEVPVQGRFETDFEIIGLPIGSGSFGTVYKCRNNWDRQCYAVKKIAPHRRGQTGRDRMLKEVQALATLCSRDDAAVFYHIVRYCQAWIQEGHLHIQMELCTSTLQAELEVLSPVASACDVELEIPAKRKPMSSGRRYKLLREILLALEFIHENNMCHLDIKPDNIFIKNDRFKLGDFGLARMTNKKSGEVEEGDSRYMASELLDYVQREDLPLCDIFSLGATMYEVCLGRPLPTDGDEWHAIRRGELQVMLDTPPVLKSIVVNMVHPVAKHRPTATALLQIKELLSPEQRDLVEANRTLADQQQQRPGEKRGRKKKSGVAIMPASISAGAEDDRLFLMFGDTSAIPSAELEAFANQVGVEGLPDCIFGTIAEYSRNFFRVNEIVRKSGVAMLPKKDSIMVRSVSLALEASPVFSFGQYCVYRGVYFEKQTDVFRFRDLWHDGRPFVESSFLSTSALHIESPELNAFNGRNTYFAIFSKTGRLIQGHSDEDWKKEAEVLFDLGTSFRILSFDDTMPDKEHGTGLDQAGRYRIVMEEI